MTLLEYILKAKQNKTAIGHFNISDSEGLWGVFRAAKSLDLPVVIGLSEGERDFLGVPQAVALVKSLREEYNWPIFLNADHTYSFERVKEVVDAGFDSVIIDGAALSFDENVFLTKKCVDYVKSSGKNILIEGELGFIGQSSKILDKVPDEVFLSNENLTSAEDALKFIEETGVDLFAPAVGNMHGMLKGGIDPKLNISRISEIAEKVSAPLVLHGASGNSDEDISLAIKAGVSVVHVNTEIRLAYKNGIMKSFEKNPEEVAPYKFMKSAVDAIEEVVQKKLKIFSNL